jgi:hypothetical protein
LRVQSPRVVEEIRGRAVVGRPAGEYERHVVVRLRECCEELARFGGRTSGFDPV